MDASERDLIARVMIGGDHRAFERLVLMHQSSVRRLLLRLGRGDRALADDLAQETFITAYRKIASYRGSGKFSAWLYRIAYNRFLQERRKRSRIPEVELRDADRTVEFETAAVARMDIERAMSALSVEQRAAITLCFSYGLTHPEACAVMDIPLGTLKSHIARGKSKLSQALAPWKHKVAV